LYSARSL